VHQLQAPPGSQQHQQGLRPDGVFPWGLSKGMWAQVSSSLEPGGQVMWDDSHVIVWAGFGDILAISSRSMVWEAQHSTAQHSSAQRSTGVLPVHVRYLCVCREQYALCLDDECEGKWLSFAHYRPMRSIAVLCCAVPCCAVPCCGVWTALWLQAANCARNVPGGQAGGEHERGR
jgi:hypothetical protein